MLWDQQDQRAATQRAATLPLMIKPTTPGEVWDATFDEYWTEYYIGAEAVATRATWKALNERAGEVLYSPRTLFPHQRLRLRHYTAARRGGV